MCTQPKKLIWFVVFQIGPPLAPPKHIDTGYRTTGESSRGDLALLSLHAHDVSKLPSPPAIPSQSLTEKTLCIGTQLWMITRDRDTHERRHYLCTITCFDHENRLWKTVLSNGHNPQRYSGSPVYDLRGAVVGMAVQGEDANSKHDMPAEIYFTPIEDILRFIDQAVPLTSAQSSKF